METGNHEVEDAQSLDDTDAFTQETLASTDAMEMLPKKTGQEQGPVLPGFECGLSFPLVYLGLSGKLSNPVITGDLMVVWLGGANK